MPHPDLRIMTFNIRFATAPDGEHGWALRRDAAISVVRDARPNVVGLQEALVCQLEELCDALPRYDRLGVGRDDGLAAGEHAAILVDRERLEVLEHGNFWFSDTPEVPGSTSWGNENVRMCSYCHVADRATGGRLWIYNLHIDHASQFSRLNSVQLLLLRIGEPAATIVTGDFNVDEGDEVIRRMIGAGFADTFRAANPDAADAGTYHDFTGGTGGDKIDYIFAGGGFATVGSEIVRRSYGAKWPSDHFPLIADVRRPEI